MDWLDELAVQIIAEVHSNSFVDARKKIADRLRAMQEMAVEATLARLRLAGAKTWDEQFDADVERREGWTNQ